MSVVVDVTGTEQNAGVASTSLAYTGITVGSGSNRALVLTIGLGGGASLPTGVTATWDNGGTNQAMTLIKTISDAVSVTATFVFGLRNPIAGNKTLQINWTNANEISACAISFTGVDQTSDANAFPHSNSASGSSATASVIITSATGNIPVTTVVTIQVPSAPNQTQIYLNTTLINSYGAQRAPGAATITFNWTITPAAQWEMAGCDVAQVAAAANPFVALDQSPPRRIRVSPYDLSQSLNPNLFKNPIPFNQYDWSKPFRVPHAPYDLSVGLNPNLFKNPIPFNQFLWTPTRRVPLALPNASVSNNPNLLGNPVPFNQFDWSKPVRIRTSPYDLSVPFNPNLPNPIPIFNPDYTRPYTSRAMPDTSIPYNLNLFTVGPIALPFNQFDWTPSRWLRSAPTVDAQFNPNLQSNPVPFNVFDWPPTSRLRSASAVEQPYNPNLYSVVVTFLPFNQYDWPQVTRSRSSPAADQSYNANLYTITIAVLPFNIYDWLPARRLPSVPLDASVALNPNLFTNPFPFNQYDWSLAQRSPTARLDQSLSSNLNLSIFTGPFPIFNTDYSTISSPRLTAPDGSVGFLIQNQSVVTVTLIQRTLTGVGL